MWPTLNRAACLFLLCVAPATAQEIVSSHAFSGEQVAQATGSGPAAPRTLSPDLALQADFDNGSTIYDNACSDCHGETGQGGQGGGPALTGNLSLSQVMLVINDGRNTMPSFDVLTDQQLLDISSFVVERLKN